MTLRGLTILKMQPVAGRYQGRPLQEFWHMTSILGLIELAMRSAMSQAIADLPIGSRCGLLPHSATAKQ
jgi:hypothetical protein